MKKIVQIESITDVHNLLGIEKPKHPLVTLLPIDEKVKNYDYGDDTFVFGFYQVAFKSGVSGSFVYGRNSYDFQEGTMVFTKPGQAMSFVNSGEENNDTGWVLLFHPDLIRQSDLGTSIEQYGFFSYEASEALHLSDEEKQSLTEIVEKIKSEYSQPIDRHSQRLIVSNIGLLLDYCTRYYDRQFYLRTNLNSDVVVEFEQLLHNYFSADLAIENGLPTVKYCAEKLNFSAAYLGDLLKKETGRNAQQHIQDYILERAKNLLLGSDQQVSQIAYSLGFEYPQHFSKLFKSKLGMSPVEYRKVN